VVALVAGRAEDRAARDLVTTIMGRATEETTPAPARAITRVEAIAGRVETEAETEAATKAERAEARSRSTGAWTGAPVFFIERGC
jgi:hypothetical protein